MVVSVSHIFLKTKSPGKQAQKSFDFACRLQSYCKAGTSLHFLDRIQFVKLGWEVEEGMWWVLQQEDR